MLNNTKSQKIIRYSKDISNLPDYTSTKHVLPVIDDQAIYPRVFPSQHLPLKVAITRQIKNYIDFDLNSALQEVDWKRGKGLLDLKYYNFQLWTCLQECTAGRMQKRLIKARALEENSSTFQEFTVLSLQKVDHQIILKGYFSMKPDQIVELNKFYVCFSFENPQKYSRIVLRASQNRNCFLANARYNFYIDNIDLEQAPQMPKKVLGDITKMIGVTFLDLEYFLQLNNHYRRTMNQILFSHTVLNDPSLHLQTFSRATIKKPSQYKPKSRVLRLQKEGKMFKLVLKSMRTKTQQIQAKSIFFRDELIYLMQQIRQKLTDIQKYPIFDLNQQLNALQRFVADNMLMVGYFTNHLSDQIITPIAKMIRKHLEEHPEGWFKIYTTDRSTYLISKLRRLFVFVEQNVKSMVKDHIREEVKKYQKVIRKRLPVKIQFESFSQFRLSFAHSCRQQIEYPPMFVLSSSLNNDNISLSMTEAKITELLLKNVAHIMDKLDKIDSPQSKALVEIFGMFRGQFGIELEFPSIFDCREGEDSNRMQVEWIRPQIEELCKLLQATVVTLATVKEYFKKIGLEVDLKGAKRDVVPPNIKIEQILNKIRHYKDTSDKIQQLLPGQGINFGPFFIEYKPAKDQILDLFSTNLGHYRLQLIRQYQYFSTTLENELNNLKGDLSERPPDIYELVKQREKIDKLESIIGEMNEEYQIHLYHLCEENECIMGREDYQRRWKNTGLIGQILTLGRAKSQEYQQIKKDIWEEIERKQEQMQDNLHLFDVTLSMIKASSVRQEHLDNCDKLQYLKTQYQSLKTQIQDVRYKEIHLNLKRHDFAAFQTLEEGFMIMYNFWESIRGWQQHRSIWYMHPFRDFELGRPQTILNEITGNIKKIQKSIKTTYDQKHYALLVEVKRQIQRFEDQHLKLLKLLKKEGFSEKHLQKIGIYLQEHKGGLDDINLQYALDHDFLYQIDEIEAVSNDAWNQYYLEQTLDRVFSQLVQLKYEVIYYLDKKQNEIPLINNYSPLNEKLQKVILDLQSVQFNPMKGQYEKRINDLYDKSIYISKALESCQLFQKKLAQLHPIFDSTDVVKQLPRENKLFTKLLRLWVELAGFMRKIVSVYDACNSQNIYEKLTSMIKNIEKVKVGLGNYLQQKRQSFNRFYLLTDQELYELYASTNDMNVLSKHISKLFSQVMTINFDEEYILAANGAGQSIVLDNKVVYKRMHLEDWLSAFQRSLKATLKNKIQRLILSKNKWTSQLSECSQALILSYEVEKTQVIQSMHNLQHAAEQERSLIRKLVEIKKEQQLTLCESTNLGSLLVLALYFSEKLTFLLNSNITDPENFQIRRIMKMYYKEEEVKIRSFETEIDYGYQYLSLVKRLVLTNLTERMQLIYMSAIRYSLGGSAIGPAGTGKSQTTKDIARICGKTCIIYNCSQALNIDILTKILKGMAVTGLWICFDQFNRLSYQVLNMVSEELSILFKYKAMGEKLDIMYGRETISFRPDFHLCITYNPTYSGRQVIPKNVTKHFRTVAMVKCDKNIICQLLLYSKGFKQATELSNKLNRVFDYCQKLWSEFELYDFGLRSLISIIELASLMYRGQGKGVSQLVDAVRVLVLPRLHSHHRLILMDITALIFQGQIQRERTVSHERQMQRLKHVLEVRIGIILVGDILSGKSSTMRLFQEKSTQYLVQNIHINSLSVQEIYGYTDPSTRIFKDGYLTKKIREYILSQSDKKMLIYIQGVIFPDWIQNLNSVLDNSRSLSLPSGQILSIPVNVKFLIQCSSLEFASPATISRSCVISFKQRSIPELIQCSKDELRLKKRILETYQEVMPVLREHFLFKIDERLLIHWYSKYLLRAKLPFTVQSFWHILSVILSGCLTEEGKTALRDFGRRYFALEEDIFSLFWDGSSWKRIKDMVGLAVRPEGERLHPAEIVVQEDKYSLFEYVNKIFLGKAATDDMLLLIGPANTGKSSIVQDIYRHVDKRVYNLHKLTLSRFLKRSQLFASVDALLHRKSNRRKGMLQGRQLVVLADDLNMPQTNKYQYQEITSFLCLLMERKGCYNYTSLDFETIEDLLMIGIYNTSSQVRVSNQFLKSSMPLFVGTYKSAQIGVIFHQIVERCNTLIQYRKVYESLTTSLISIMQKMPAAVDGLVPSYLRYDFLNYRKIISNVLLWDLSKNNALSDQLIKSIFIYETERMLLARLHQEDIFEVVQSIIRSGFEVERDEPVLLHNFDKSINGIAIDEKLCLKVDSMTDFMREVEYICDEYILTNDISHLSLVVIPQMCVQLCRISRGLTLKKGNISLIGLPKCGKKVLLELSSYLIHGKIYHIADNYDQKNWYQVIRSATKESLINKCPSVLLIQQFQLTESSQKEELNLLLKHSFVPTVYTQADFQELTYLFQNQLIRDHVAVNKDNTLQYFMDYLQQKLKMVMMFNPKTQQFRQDMINYPSIAKNSELHWLTEWPIQALLRIATQTLIESEYESIMSIFPTIHEKCKNIRKERSKVVHWEGLYFDFLHLFHKFYEQNKKELTHKMTQLDKSFDIIKETELKLEATRDEIKNLQPKIMMLEKETSKTIKSLNMQKHNAETTNQKLLQKEKQCAKIIAQADAVKINLEIVNAKVEEDLNKAWQNVYLVKQSHIAQIKALMNPSDLIKIVIAAIVIVINQGDIEVMRSRSEDGFTTEDNYFQTGKRFILSKDSKQIMRLLTEYKKEKMTKQKVAMLEDKCLNHPRWNLAQAKSANKAIYYFFLWIEAVVKYFRLYQETIPMREELERTTALSQSKKKEIQTVKKELAVYDTKIKQLTETLKEKTERLNEYSNQIQMFEKMINRGHEIMVEITSQKGKWEDYKEAINVKMDLNMGNSILSAVMVVYASPLFIEIRQEIVYKIKKILKERSIKCDEDNIFWLMEREEEIVLKQMGIYYNEYILNNLKVIEKTDKTVFIVDPEQEGLKYLKTWYKQKGFLFQHRISIEHSTFKRTLQRAISDGTMLFIEISGQTCPQIVKQMINPTIHKNQSHGNLQILIEDKYLPYNPKFKPYFFTTSQSGNLSIELISRVTTVNFSITLHELQQKLINIVIAIQYPEQNEELEELNKMSIKDNLQLRNIQTKILNIFSQTTAEAILKTEETLHVLSTSNRLYAQIQGKIQESREKRQLLMGRRDSFRGKCGQAARLYFQVKKLSKISRLYQYSFDWFINLFQIGPNSFSEHLSVQLTKGLPPELKVIVPLLISQSQFRKIPFHKLFNTQLQTSQFVLDRYNKLKVSKQRLQKIVGNVKNSDIHMLDRVLVDHPEKFQQMLIAPISEIMESIPDEFSQCQFFQKIELINCFRPDCTIKLLMDWFNINIGTVVSPQMSRLLQYTSLSTPIMVYQPFNARLSSLDYIDKVYEATGQDKLKAICYVNANYSKLERVRAVIESAFDNDQWAVLEGLGEAEGVTALVVSLFEEVDFRRKESFRLWIIVNEYQLKVASEKLIKISMKVHFTEQTDLPKRIASSYHTLLQPLKKLQNTRQLNKKKYILNELVIFHHLLNQKYNFQSKLWNQFNNFDETDLLLNSKYLLFTQPEQAKRLYPDIVSNIIYGGKVTDQKDIETISLHIQEAIRGTNLQRNYFWQTVWADDKFPKNQQQYEHYIKSTVMHKIAPPFKNIFQIYGITSFVKNDARQKQYRMVCDFYHQTKKMLEHQDALTAAQRKLKGFSDKIGKKLYKMSSAFSQNQAHPLHHFLLDEQEYYLRKMSQIRQQFRYFLELQDLLDQQDTEWCISILRNKIPSRWNIRSTLNLDQWLLLFLQGYVDIFQMSYEAADRKNQSNDLTRIYNIDLTHHFASFCQCILALNSATFQTHQMFWEPLKVDLISNHANVKIQRWYLWNAQFDKGVRPLEEGTIKQHYFITLPKGTLTIVEKSEAMNLSNYEAIEVYEHSFQYGGSPPPIVKIYMPVHKQADKEWLKRMRVHLTLSI